MTEDQFERLAQLIHTSAEETDAKIDELDIKLSGHIDKLETKIDAIDHRLISVESKIDGIHRRIDTEVEERLMLKVRIDVIEKHLGINRSVAA